MMSVNKFTPIQMSLFRIGATHVNVRTLSKCVQRPRAFLGTLEKQQQIEFRDIVTGDEGCIYLDTNPNSIWIDAEEKIPRDRT
jgi:hypothetical protein